MIFYNMDKIAENAGIQNKYMLTLVIAQRARQLSEMRGAPAEGEEEDEKYISQALQEMESGRLSVSFNTVNPQLLPGETNGPSSMAE